jgi:hypothetical protein
MFRDITEKVKKTFISLTKYKKKVKFNNKGLSMLPSQLSLNCFAAVEIFPIFSHTHYFVLMIQYGPVALHIEYSCVKSLFFLSWLLFRAKETSSKKNLGQKKINEQKDFLGMKHFMPELFQLFKANNYVTSRKSYSGKSGKDDSRRIDIRLTSEERF